LTASLILKNVRALTMDPAQPRASAVAVGGGRILAVGDEVDVEALRGPATRVIDGGGRALLPGFVDAHCHLLAYAAYLLSVDCASAPSIADIQAALRRRAQELRPGIWLRAVGYHEADLREGPSHCVGALARAGRVSVEGRHPNRWDLDAAVPHHPVRLIHRSGHACVLNSPALELCQININTEEPPGGYIDREPTTGEPTGLLLEMNDLVEAHIPPLPYEDLCRGAALASQRLLAGGVTAVQDATPGGPGERALLDRLAAEGHIRSRLRSMVGYEHRYDWDEVGAGPGACPYFVKIVVRELGQEVYPGPEALADMLREVHQAGLAAAIHAVEERAIEAALSALERLPRPDRHRHRLEHCALCPPLLAGRLARLGATVVTQPSFLYHSGDRYLREVPPEKQGYLYPLAELQRRGVPLAAGSDAPVAPPDPLLGIYGAVARRSREVRPLAGQGLSAQEALEMHTLAAARACGWEAELGSITPGKRADLVLLSDDPTTVPAELIPSLTVALVILEGEVAWGEV